MVRKSRPTVYFGSTEEMWNFLSEDVSNSVSRYFAPVRGLIIGAEKNFGAPYYWGYKQDKNEDEDKKTAAG